MRLKHKNSGFTLLEIIIVIIIVGVLASLALPRFFRTVEYSRSAEALTNIAAIRQSIERCYLPRANYANCNNFGNLDAENPNGLAGTLFTYTLGPAAFTIANYEITATRNTVSGGAITSFVRLNSSAGLVVRSGGTVFAGIQ